MNSTSGWLFEHAAAVSRASKQQALFLLRAGQNYAVAGHLQTAMHTFVRCIDAHGEDASCTLVVPYTFVEYVRTKSRPGKRRELAEATAAGDSRPTWRALALYVLARSDAARGDLDSFEKRIRKLISVYPCSPYAAEAASQLSWLLMARGRWDEAQRTLSGLLHSWPGSPAADFADAVIESLQTPTGREECRELAQTLQNGVDLLAE